MPQWVGLAATTSRFLDFLVKFSLVFDVRIKNGYRWAIKGWKTAPSHAKRTSILSSDLQAQTRQQVGLLLKMVNGCVCCRRYRGR
jgi:hypothetical protein